MRNVDIHDLATKIVNFYYDYDYYDFIDTDIDVDEFVEDTERSLLKYTDKYIEETNNIIAELRDIVSNYDGDRRHIKLINRARDILYDLKALKREGLKEDTVKQGSHWVNKGKEGTHGKFRTKKAADAQRKAMFANSGKNRSFGESLKEDFHSQIDWRKVRFSLDNMLGNVKVTVKERKTSKGSQSIADFEFTLPSGRVVKCIMQGTPERINVIFPSIKTSRVCYDEYDVVKFIDDLFFDEM